jgi:hypothetical protein
MYVSMTEDLLLVSEDLHYRNLARQLHGRDGVWLQAALMVARDTGKMEAAAYARAVCDLAMQRHDHVTLSAPTLIAIALADQDISLDRFKAAAAFIGTLNADLESHQLVSWEFLRAIWRTNLPYVRRAKAASLILERLVTLMVQRNLFPAAYSDMIANSRDKPLLQEALLAWACGHFIPLARSAEEEKPSSVAAPAKKNREGRRHQRALKAAGAVPADDSLLAAAANLTLNPDRVRGPSSR